MNIPKISAKAAAVRGVEMEKISFRFIMFISANQLIDEEDDKMKN